MVSKKVSAIKNDELPSRIITLGEITIESVNEIIHSIYEINKTATKEPIQLIINSPGGDIYSGLGLIDVIQTSETPIHTICHGSVMSMALIVYVAGHYRLAGRYATFMYHEASYQNEGKLKYHKQELKEAERIELICNEFLISRSNLSDTQIDNVINKRKDWYFNATDALEYGIIDKIL